MAVLTNKDKSVLFLSINKPSRVDLCLNRNMPNMLISYLYYKKAPKQYSEKIDTLINSGGLYMVDSGAHTFQKSTGEDAYKPETWIPFLEEYCEYLELNSSKIYCAANLDIENVVGVDVVNEWNVKYFEPLRRKTNIVFVNHEDVYPGDPYGFKRFDEYCDAYDYLGLGQSVSRFMHKFYTKVQQRQVKVHGFAYTSLKSLKQYPMFSVDSTSWTMGERYGATFDYDGKNFRTFDKKRKYVRQGKRLKCEDNNVDYEGLLKDRVAPTHDFNLLAWEGFEKEMLKFANLKLNTKPVLYYDKRGVR